MSLKEDINLIAWSQLQHAYGSAKDTPDHLLSLLSSNEEERSEALNALWASICHQGSVYEASCTAIPFLLQIVQQIPDDQKPSILYLLAELAHQNWYANQHQRILRFEKRHKMWSPGTFLKEGNEFHDPKWMHLAHQKVAEGLPEYLSFLQISNNDVLLATLYVLSGLPERGALIIPTIEALYISVTDPFVQASALMCLSSLLENESPQWKLYHQALDTKNTNAHALVHFVSALSLATYHSTAITPSAIDTLVHALISPQDLDKLFYILPWNDYGFAVHRKTRSALAQLGIPSGLNALIRAFNQGSPHWRILDTLRVAEALLDVAFFGTLVHNRNWTYRIQLDQPQQSSSESPHKEQSYYSYDRSSTYTPNPQKRTESTPFISCWGYHKGEAKRLQLRGTQALNTYQKQAILTILRCEEIWRIKHDLMQIYGLPISREELQGIFEEK